ncbi:MAG: tRNA lysidine(34) synthetase TilS, partial [Nitrospirae bacterium]|nr:tRNA lysidine(34) synthetase TilS [Nitrospirota bacterium]
LSPGDRVVVAVSGGPDSVCMLRALLAFMSEYELTLHVAHLDHRFRGEESAAEAQFVRGLAARLGLPATIEASDVPAYCRERGLSAQAGAREVRYAFLQEVAKREHAARIALGHTANDQAETLLMRLIRGAGAAGLASIPPVRENIIRPLIDVTREEVLAYLKEHGQDFITDPSNLKPFYTRNRVRLEVLPVLERFNPRIVEALATAAEVLRDENAAMEASLAAVIDRTVRQDGKAVRIARTEFFDLLPALRRRVLRKALALSSGEEAPGLSSVQTDEALAFMAETQTGRMMELPGGLSLEREYDSFLIRQRERVDELSIPLAVPGRTEVPGTGLQVEVQVCEILERDDGIPSRRGTGDDDEGSFDENYLWQAQFDYDKIVLPLSLRSRRVGDWFCPAGMEGKSKKLQDYFVDEKVPRFRRAAVPLLTTEQDLVWIVGMRTDGRYLPGPKTKKLLTVRVRRAR